MEVIFGFIVIFGGYWLLGVIWRAISAAGKAAVSKGSFSDNFEDSFRGMQAWQSQLIDSHLGDDNDGPLIKSIQAKGLFPITTPMKMGFITSVFDNTSGEFEPVMSALEDFQEPHTPVYQHIREVGLLEPDYGFKSWVNIGTIFPDFIQPPYSGRRNMVAYVRMVDMNHMPSITHGFHDESDSFLWVSKHLFSYDFVDKGYKEAVEHRDEARALTVKVGLAVALADGSLDKTEGETIKNWVLRTIEPYDEEKQAILKDLFNGAMRDAYADAKEGNLSLSDLTTRLNEIGEKKIKYETIELCFDVMAADGVADAAEMKMIRRIADALDLDLDEMEKLRDIKMVGLDMSVADHASIEDILGIDMNWETDLIKKHLRSEFQKWNNRLNTLSEGDERQNAQHMLDVIANARKKYG